MDEDEFERELQRLIGTARRNEVPLRRLTDILATELEGLEMAVEEGELY